MLVGRLVRNLIELWRGYVRSMPAFRWYLNAAHQIRNYYSYGTSKALRAVVEFSTRYL